MDVLSEDVIVDNSHKIILTTILLLIIIPLSDAIKDYPQFFYGINWVGNSCDNLEYAKNMGYQYIIISTWQNPQNCPQATNLKFYTMDARKPTLSYDIRIDLNNLNLKQNTTYLNSILAKKNNDTYPLNLATGWYETTTLFNPLFDLQQQKIINQITDDIIKRIKNNEKPLNNFTFAGYAYDVPQLTGDYWTGLQSNSGQQVTLSYWTGTDSAIPETGITYDYQTYSEAQKEFYKQLIKKTHDAGYSEVNFLIEPYNIYNSWIKTATTYLDYQEYKPTITCSESNDITYLKDPKVTNIIPYSELCTTTPNERDDNKNLIIFAELTTKGAWFNWFGRFGGTGNMPSYQNVQEVPKNLLMLRAVSGWENIAETPLNERKWDYNTLTYDSPTAHADPTIIYATHPNGNIYIVTNTNDNIGIPQSQTLYENIYTLNDLWKPNPEPITYTIIKQRIILPKGTYMMTRTEKPQEKTTITPLTPPKSDETTTINTTYNTKDLITASFDTILKFINAIGNTIKR